MKATQKAHEKKVTKTRWGRWSLDAKPNGLGDPMSLNFVLRHDRVPGYEVDIDRMQTPADVLDWIFQVTAKRWVTTRDAGNLIEALRDRIDPQWMLDHFAMNTTGTTYQAVP